MEAKGTFEVAMNAEPPFETVHGITLARMTFDKQFAGALKATSRVHALGARTARQDSACYVALERIEGSLDGRAGSFVVAHLGLMDRGNNSQQVAIVPDSGAEQLVGIRGAMTIEVLEGQHHYQLQYTFRGEDKQSTLRRRAGAPKV